jgi:heme-degrading monooxygenase HmoA
VEIRNGDWGYLIVWEFRVRAGLEKQFELAYGPHGVWAQLFQRGQGYLTTELVRDPRNPGRYLTLDVWTSRSAYEHFHEQHPAEYEELDRQCEVMTETELEMGKFERIGS